MDFIAIIVLLAVYYLRPQEWFHAFSTLRPAMFSLAFAIATMFFRERGFSLRSLIKTPHDWLVFAFFAWTLFTAGSMLDTWSRVKVLLVSYIVIVQAVYTWKRLNLLLIWWMIFITFICTMAVLSEYGIDPLGSAYITHMANKGRLSFNLSIFDNPNALGHSIVPLILMIYFFFIWKRPLFIKEVGILLMILPAYALYLTQSKGAYLSGFATLLAGLTFGRPRIVQILILVFALTVGWAGVQMLPRMEQMRGLRADEGVLVRIQAWKVGMDTMKALYPKGAGVDTFQSIFQRVHGYPKAPHSSYVQIGTELGYGGLILFVGIIYCCFYTLIKTKTYTEDEERIRRVLMVMLVSYCVSSWMIGWGLNLTFYLIAATIAAFHRLCEERAEQKFEEYKQAVEEVFSAPRELELSPAQQTAGTDTIGYKEADNIQVLPEQPRGALVPAVAMSSSGAEQSQLAINPVNQLSENVIEPAGNETTEDQEEPVSTGVKKPWSRPRLLDLILIWALTYAVIWFWQYVMKRF